jgi:hypothetical protein
MNRLKFQSFLLFGLLAASCRIAKSGSDTPSENPDVKGSADVGKTQTPAQPSMQTQTGTPSQALGIHLDDQGIENGRAVLRLDYVAAPQASGVTIPKCHEPILGHLVIARIVCGANPSLSSDVTASSFDQTCFTQSSSPKVSRKQPVSLNGCLGPSTLQVYGLKPGMKVEIGISQ